MKRTEAVKTMGGNRTWVGLKIIRTQMNSQINQRIGDLDLQQNGRHVIL